MAGTPSGLFRGSNDPGFTQFRVKKELPEEFFFGTVFLRHSTEPHLCRHNERQQDNQEDIARSQEHTTPLVPNWDVNEEAPLPPWDKVLEAAQTFLVYCDCQPLPLFHRQTFLATLGHRDPEIIYAILALAIRFCSADVLNGMFGNDTLLQNPVPAYIEAARERVIKRVLKGPVEISTLQTLCLLSMIDSTSKP